MCRVIAPFITFALLLTTACAHRVPVSAPIDERAQRWDDWAARVESLPGCLAPELEAAPREAPLLVPGDTVQVRGRLGLLELDCGTMINELILRGLWLPDPNAVLSLRELDDAVARSERKTCGSMLGVRLGAVELALDPPFPVRVWRENDAEVFDALLAQTDVVVVGVIEANSGRQAVIEPTRVCRAPGPSLELTRLPDDSRRWKVLDGVEYLSNLSAVSRLRRAQALRVLYDLTAQTEPHRALRAAERLVNEFGDRSRLVRQSQ
ncbi:MAG: hypothetical protein Q8S33_37750 [Myxococcales bacterium]|nr:hypothetical protein [Myxococcales bacterium]MDP3506145.1 hypothetical protein [Myxococcales bacterium]